MIKAQVRRTDAGDVESFTIVGHAGYAERGQDIVCAAVSGISFGAINAIHSLLDVELGVEQGKDGYLRCLVPHFEDVETHQRVQLLLDGMIASLQSVAFEYGQFVSINDQNNTRRWTSC
ncbi:hypothetical protein BEP19_05620 [Ammoniphilus oxalaticus]|uniref:Ribosomal processing cysteine protease Prp n=1 Tax=Ammoniphilus oxalaticus TaxID=66863 RepID=A0A419SIT9_9BACL|nr:ribosomal-processing cysteine protease Prp [Ammoniphilus oxalaticus]RKD23905.1 hypothetical protein BEP19_05620 [Ammoniphilus oxalaticus]